MLDEIDLAVTVTPLGAIFRIEHARDGFEEDRERYRQRLAEYQRRLSSYQSRQAGTLPLPTNWLRSVGSCAGGGGPGAIRLR